MLKRAKFTLSARTEGWNNQMRNCQATVSFHHLVLCTETLKTLWKATEAVLSFCKLLLCTGMETPNKMRPLVSFLQLCHYTRILKNDRLCREESTNCAGKKQQIDLMPARYSCCLTWTTSGSGTRVAAGNCTTRSCAFLILSIKFWCPSNP